MLYLEFFCIFAFVCKISLSAEIFSKCDIITTSPHKQLRYLFIGNNQLHRLACYELYNSIWKIEVDIHTTFTTSSTEKLLIISSFIYKRKKKKKNIFSLTFFTFDFSTFNINNPLWKYIRKKHLSFSRDIYLLFFDRVNSWIIIKCEIWINFE